MGGGADCSSLILFLFSLLGCFCLCIPWLMGFVWTALLFLFFFQHDARHFVVVNFAEMQLFFATRLVGPRAVSTYIAGKNKVPSNAYEAVECAQGMGNIVDICASFLFMCFMIVADVSRNCSSGF